jgi:acyl carrier protein
MDPIIYDVLTDIFRKVFDRGDMIITPELTAMDVPGWNSFRQIEIIIEIEERYGIRLESEDVDHLENVGDLADVIASKT